ncbi:MAG: tyrosine-type recombinase/integrase [Bacteroidia bacterium]
MKNRFELQTTAYQLLLKEYDSMINALGYRQTGKTYQNNVKEFLWYLETNGHLKIKKLQPIDMITYYEYLTTRPNLRTEGILSSSSISNHMFSIDLLFDYLIEKKLLDKKIILPRHSRNEGKQRNVLTIDEVMSLYNICENKRDKAILSIAYGCGARRHEIELLNVSDVQLLKGILIVRNGKNDKRREIPLSNAIINDLKDYLIHERHLYFKNDNQPRTESFLINNKGQRMQGDHMNERLKELIAKVGNPEMASKDITLHCLRHSIATHLLENGANIEFVRDYLGHAEIDTVHVYAKRRKIKQLLMQH